MKKLEFIGGCSGKYWDESGSHLVKPGDVVEFSDSMAKHRLKESCWREYKEEKQKPAKAGKDGD